MAIRLYLSSQGLGEESASLRPTSDETHQALIVVNALDPYPMARQYALPQEMTQLAALGYHCSELDLRDYFQLATDPHQHNQGKETRLAELLAGSNLIWVAGGNTFVLARAMQQSQLKTALLAAADLAHHTITYGGYSAGAAVIGPDLQGIHLMDDPKVLPDQYDPNTEAIALNLVSERIIPHYRSQSDDSANADRAVAYLEKARLKFRTLRDGEVWLTNC
ncbi:unannotated protein [freshwater metagenome]|uniref:Unannotated protein n=1 Tax=freshwater metagenome TaxID=449393 RepID=A0A6J6IJ12_9ZZZZ|nr:peptidase E [Actinomycetota bacterium]MSY38970.1 peptidase E [Actinomycetota bacterium]MSZ41686.1 peptidase E [Actinomycetota bacterium]